MRNGRAIATMLAVLLCALSLVASADDLPRATGFLLPTRGAALLNDVSSRKAGLLRSSAKTSLPAQWNSCEHGWISPVKNQGQVGACWAFAAYATLETQLLIAGKGEWDFSEKNMVNLHGWKLDPNDGGNSDVAASYLLRWGGAVVESNDVYKSSMTRWTYSPSLSPAVRVQHVVWTEPLDGSRESSDALKEAIIEYGAVATSAYFKESHASNWSYYYSGNNNHNHAITIVGWDDDYPTNNFKVFPPGPGAWIMKNSWGGSVGSNGFYYVSYHDSQFARFYNGAVFVPAKDDEDYDAVRGHDRFGPVKTVSGSYDCQAAVFTAAWNERLDAVGVWSPYASVSYEISVYTNVTRGGGSPTDGGRLATSQSGTLAHAGFTTIHLATPVALADGTSFAVVYRQTGSKSSYSMCVDSADKDDDGYYYCIPEHARGNSYFGKYRMRGVTWTDGVDATVGGVSNLAACIKAYTRSTVSARTGDAPFETDDGTTYLSDLERTNATLFAETAETFGASVGLVGTNGRSLWTSWLSGLDPSVEGSAEFTVSIDVSGGVPSLTWSPDLGAARTYTVWGRETLDTADSWEPVGIDSIGTSQFKFFKVTVGQ